MVTQPSTLIKNSFQFLVDALDSKLLPSTFMAVQYGINFFQISSAFRLVQHRDAFFKLAKLIVDLLMLVLFGFGFVWVQTFATCRLLVMIKILVWSRISFAFLFALPFLDLLAANFALFVFYTAFASLFVNRIFILFQNILAAQQLFRTCNYNMVRLALLPEDIFITFYDVWLAFFLLRLADRWQNAIFFKLIQKLLQLACLQLQLFDLLFVSDNKHASLLQLLNNLIFLFKLLIFKSELFPKLGTILAITMIHLQRVTSDRSLFLAQVAGAWTTLLVGVGATLLAGQWLFQ